MAYDKTIYDVTNEAAAATALLAEIGNDDDELSHDMVEGETSYFEAIDRAITAIDECAITVVGCKEVEAKIASRRNRAEKRAERLRGLIEQSMLMVGLGSIKRPTATLTVKDVKPKPIIQDESALPTKYWKQPDPVIDKKELNADAKDGPIAGVVMSNGGTSLQIRRA